MAILSRGEAVGVSNPKLQFLAVTKGPDDFLSGRLTDVELLEYQILDISTPAKRTSPSEVVARTAVDLVTDRLGLGRYVADYTVDASASAGRHEVRWYYKVVATGVEQQERYEFDVIDSISAAAPTPFYCFPSDLKDEGICGRTDAFLLGRIGLASRYIEKVTGRFFEPRYLQINVDGRGSRILQLGMPIIGIETVAFETSPYQPSSDLVDDELLRVYSRHLTQGLVQPDDRNNPKIELFHHSDDITQGQPFSLDNLSFPRGQQNIIVKGVFGYTDLNGQLCGGTPDPIRHVCKLLVTREIDKLASVAARDDALKRYRIKSERTREQAYSLESLSAIARFGHFTGDPDIDFVLSSYVRPPAIGSV